MVIVIPAYEPDSHLVKLVEQLLDNTNYPIVIVDDGSSTDKKIIFHRLRTYVNVVTHPENLGKGAAMKTALQFIGQNYPNEDGVVFMDADGQHSIEDMNKVIEAFYENENALIMGSREFSGKVPIKSLLGNKITKTIFKLSSGVEVSDTQTGLRAVSTKYIPFLIEIEGNRYEYEMNMLYAFAKEKKEIVEVPIETIYEDSKNSTSHFRVIQDSIRIYSVIFKFMTSSLACAVLDYYIFFCLLKIFANVQNSMAIVLFNCMARLVSAVTNYHFNKIGVFKNEGNNKNSAVKYAMLAIGILTANSVVLYVLTNVLLFPAALAKIFTEILMFFISFTVQHKFIFKAKPEGVSAKDFKLEATRIFEKGNRTEFNGNSFTSTNRCMQKSHQWR